MSQPVPTAMPEKTAGLPFRPDLQGLRAIAILLVVLAHAGVTFFSGGFVGVDVFFVLSGYLITGLLQRELAQDGRLAFVRFYARRLRRLLPALVVMLAVTASATLLLLSDTEVRSQLASAPFATTWTSNLYFAFTTRDYFDELAMRDLYLHTWSLGVEEQFYLIWPLLLLGLFLIGRRQQTGNLRISSFSVLGIVFVSSLAVSLYWSFDTPHTAFYLMPSRIWQFALGAMVYLTFDGYRFKNLAWGEEPRNANIAAWVTLASGLLLILGSAIALHESLTYPGYWALVPSLGAALVIVAGNSFSNSHGGPLAHPALVWVGNHSYSWYLWHWPVLMLGFSLGLKDQPLSTLALVLVSLLSAILSYRFVELPFWKGRFSHTSPARTLLAGLLIMAVMLAALFHVLRLLPAQHEARATGNHWRTDVPVIYRLGCDTGNHSEKVAPCIFGQEEATSTVVLLGDSIGAQWFSMIPILFPTPKWSTVVLTKSSCPMVDEDYFYPRLGQIYKTCTDWRNAVLNELETLKPDILVMGSAATYDFNETQWTEGSARVLERLSKVTTTIFVIPPTPSLGFDGPGCVSRHLSPEGRIDRGACVATGRMQRIAPATRYLEHTADRFPNVHVLDLNDVVCPLGVCSAISHDGLVVFRDSQHLTDNFVRERIPVIQERIMRYLSSEQHPDNQGK